MAQPLLMGGLDGLRRGPSYPPRADEILDETASGIDGSDDESAASQHSTPSGRGRSASSPGCGGGAAQGLRFRLLSNSSHLLMLSLELDMIKKQKISAPLKPRWGKHRADDFNPLPSTIACTHLPQRCLHRPSICVRRSRPPRAPTALMKSVAARHVARPRKSQCQAARPARRWLPSTRSEADCATPAAAFASRGASLTSPPLLKPPRASLFRPHTISFCMHISYTFAIAIAIATQSFLTPSTLAPV